MQLEVIRGGLKPGYSLDNLGMNLSTWAKGSTGESEWYLADRQVCGWRDEGVHQMWEGRLWGSSRLPRYGHFKWVNRLWCHQVNPLSGQNSVERWTGDRVVQGSNPAAATYSLWNFGNSAYPALPVSFGGDTESRRSLLSARGSKRSHQSALEMYRPNLSWTPPPTLRPCSHLFRFAFWSRSGPVPLVHVAFTPAKIDRTRCGCGPVMRSHLFRTRSGTRTVSIPGC